MPSARTLVIELAVVLAITLVIAFLAPLGSFQLGGLEERFLYWSLMLFGGYVIVRPFMLLASGLTALLQLSEAAVWLGLVATAALPVTLLVWFGSGSSSFPTPAEFLRLFPNVLMIGALVASVFWVMNRRPEAAPAERPGEHASSNVPAASALVSGPRILERLPVGQRGPILALETEDHYVRIHGETGSTLLLIRMRDAVAEMREVEGMQVHRSWWVARSAVVGRESNGRALRLVLSNGLLVPVARGSVQAVQDAGWLSRP